MEKWKLVENKPFTIIITKIRIKIRKMCKTTNKLNQIKMKLTIWKNEVFKIWLILNLFGRFIGVMSIIPSIIIIEKLMNQYGKSPKILMDRILIQIGRAVWMNLRFYTTAHLASAWEDQLTITPNIRVIFSQKDKNNLKMKGLLAIGKK